VGVSIGPAEVACSGPVEVGVSSGLVMSMVWLLTAASVAEEWVAAGGGVGVPSVQLVLPTAGGQDNHFCHAGLPSHAGHMSSLVMQVT
jgi:hypothetical protein